MKTTRNSFIINAVVVGVFALLPFSARAEVTDDCKAALKAMSEKLAAAKSLKATGTRSIDPLLIGEGAVKANAEVSVVVERPTKIYSEVKDEKSTRHLYFDGKKMVMTDTNEVGTFHAGKEFPADSIESFSSKLLKDYGYQPPMTEFFSEDPYKLLLEDVKSGSVAGEEDVDGVPCKKLSLAQEGLSWDLWLSEKDGLPRKLVITFLEIDGSPKYEALISSWELNPDVSKVNFTWEAPETAIELGIIPAEPTEEAPAEQIKK